MNRKQKRSMIIVRAANIYQMLLAINFTVKGYGGLLVIVPVVLFLIGVIVDRVACECYKEINEKTKDEINK